jgi:hypothetical protein
MAQRKIAGDDILLFIDPLGGTDYDTIVCLTEQQFNRATTEIDAKSKCGPDKLPGAQNIELTFQGQIVYGPDSGNISESGLHTLWQNSTTIGWKLGKASPVTGDVTYSGTGFISRLNSAFAMDSPSTFDGSIGVYGSVTQTVSA